MLWWLLWGTISEQGEAWLGILHSLHLMGVLLSKVHLLGHNFTVALSPKFGLVSPCAAERISGGRRWWLTR